MGSRIGFVQGLLDKGSFVGTTVWNSETRHYELVMVECPAGLSLQSVPEVFKALTATGGHIQTSYAYDRTITDDGGTRTEKKHIVCIHEKRLLPMTSRMVWSFVTSGTPEEANGFKEEVLRRAREQGGRMAPVGEGAGTRYPSKNATLPVGDGTATTTGAASGM